MHEASGESYAKIILIGEHAVVYGYPAIALPVKSIRLLARLMPTADHQQLIDSTFYTGSLQDAASTDFAGIAELVTNLLTHFGQAQAGFTLTITSDLPPERGMGSSAATATAVVRALFAACDAKLTRRELLAWTARSEAAIHGNPSGLDAATTSADAPQWFTKGRQPQPIKFPTNGTLVIADTGIPGQTKLAVAAVARHLQANPRATKPRLAAIGQAVKRAAQALETDDLHGLGRQLDQAQVQLAALGVSNPQLDELIAAAKAAGALGAKLTGSGQGGCMIALAENASQAAAIQAALTAAGASATWQYDFSAE